MKKAQKLSLESPQPDLPRVLLVESDSKETDHLSSLVREVADCHIDVISVSSNSLEWLEQHNYHLILIALSEERRRGEISLLEKIKRISPETSVIVIAFDGNVEDAVAAIRLGAEDYLRRPFSPDALKLAVKRGLDRKVVFKDDQTAASILSLINSCQMISASLEEHKIFKTIQGYFARELGSTHSGFYVLSSEGPVRVSIGAQDRKPDQAVDEILDIAVNATNPFEKIKQVGEFFRFQEKSQLTPGLFVFRFHCARAEDYFFVLLSPRKPLSLDAFEHRIKMLWTQIDVTGKNIAQYKGVEHLVYVDDATGLYNTRYMNTVLDNEIAHAKGSKKSFAVLFMDADKFKAVNDTHGHLVGTKLLNDLGAHLKLFVRESDTVFRYGGDEFVAILSPCDLATAKTVAERIRESVEAMSFSSKDGAEPIRITVSIGVALFPDHARTKKAIIECADHAMYQAKKLSRNCVYIMPLAER